MTLLAAVASVATLFFLPVAASAHTGHDMCVGPHSGCLPTLRSALAAAADGSTIHLAAGTYRGGLTIAKSVTLVGAGESRTVIRGGGPVVTITLRDDGTRPTVVLRSLGVTAGVTTEDVTNGDGVVALGGGLYIPAPGGKRGATVTLDHVWVHGNRAAAAHVSTSPSGVKCPKGDCPFAFSAGGGIANFGNLTLRHSRVEANYATGRVSDADGGGIYNGLGSLKLLSSVVAGNQARPESIGRFAEGGGVFLTSGSLDVNATTIVGNSADLMTSWPVSGQGEVIDMNANSGGIHIGDGIKATIRNSRLVGNHISAIDPHGEPAAFDSAMLVGDSDIRVDHSDFVGNAGYARTATDADIGDSGNAVEFDGPGTMTHSRVSDNTAVSIGVAGPAGVAGGVAVYDFSSNPRQVTIADSVISGNRSFADSDVGPANGNGGGVINNSLLDLNRVTIADNKLRVAGSSPTAQGGGVWNGPLLSGPPVRLRVSHSRISGNAVSTDSGGTSQGGGIYTLVPFTRTVTTISHNRPDDLFRG
jgi:hypothetical protein